MRFVLDATYTFDEPSKGGPEALSADLLTRVAATHLDTHFATVVATSDALSQAATPA